MTLVQQASRRYDLVSLDIDLKWTAMVTAWHVSPITVADFARGA
jgi:hypothetical protein